MRKAIESLEARVLMSVQADVGPAGEQAALEAGTPTIAFTRIPAFGSTTNLSGTVSADVDFREYRVAVVIEVDSLYFCKPRLQTSLSRITKSGSFRADVTTGGTDELATTFLAFLVPKSYAGEPLFAVSEIPAYLRDAAIASVETPRIPDLAAEIESITPLPGDRVQVAARVENTSNIGLRYRITTDLLVNGTPISSRRQALSIEPNGSKSIVFTAKVPAGTTGSRLAELLVDSKNAIEEASESNNTVSLSF